MIFNVRKRNRENRIDKIEFLEHKNNKHKKHKQYFYVIIMKLERTDDDIVLADNIVVWR
jgi:hypothetical protein